VVRSFRRWRDGLRLRFGVRGALENQRLHYEGLLAAAEDKLAQTRQGCMLEIESLSASAAETEVAIRRAYEDRDLEAKALAVSDAERREALEAVASAAQLQDQLYCRVAVAACFSQWARQHWRLTLILSQQRAGKAVAQAFMKWDQLQARHTLAKGWAPWIAMRTERRRRRALGERVAEEQRRLRRRRLVRLFTRWRDGARFKRAFLHMRRKHAAASKQQEAEIARLRKEISRLKRAASPPSSVTRPTNASRSWRVAHSPDWMAEFADQVVNASPSSSDRAAPMAMLQAVHQAAASFRRRGASPPGDVRQIFESARQQVTFHGDDRNGTPKDFRRRS